MGLPQLKEQVLSLPADQREELVYSLIISLEGEPATLDEDWCRELDRRYADYKSGKTQAIPAEQVFDEIRRDMGWSKE